MPATPTEDEVLAYFERCSNWGRWGAEDELGTLNHLTADARRAAAALVREGTSVSCARLIPRRMEADFATPPLHYMAASGECHAGKETPPDSLQIASDFNPFKHIVEAPRAVFRGDFANPIVWIGALLAVVLVVLGAWVGARTLTAQTK